MDSKQRILVYHNRVFCAVSHLQVQFLPIIKIPNSTVEHNPGDASFIHAGSPPVEIVLKKYVKNMLPTCFELPYVNDAYNVVQITFYED